MKTIRILGQRFLLFSFRIYGSRPDGFVRIWYGGF